MSSIFELYEEKRFRNLRSKGELSLKDLEKFSNHSSPNIRSKVVDFAQVPTSLLYKLSNDISPQVRINILLNPKCPSDLVERLANDDFYETQYYAARHFNANENALKILSESKHWRIREAVAYNPKTKNYVDILKKLSGDNNDDVSYYAMRALSSIQ